MGGFKGRIAFIDLTKGTTTEQTLPESMYRRFIGGVGLGVRTLLENMKPGVDPLGPDNILGFLPGLLSGTALPMATKFSVVAKSPLTRTWGEANSGGLFGAELKAAGYDALFFSGISPEPVYIFVGDKGIEIRDAAHLWGKDTVETPEILARETGEKRLRLVCIGPAGEAGSLISCMVTENGRAAGRSGLGAVMGSKRLKAVAVKSKADMDVADPDELDRLKKETITHLQDLEKLPFIKLLVATGTCSGLLSLIPMGASPIQNWRLIGEDAFPEYQKIAGESITTYQLRKSGCGNCPINCGGTVRVEQGPYATEGRKPEYETIAAFGNMLLNTDPEAIIKANDICDRYGLDTISAGTTIAFAMECYEKGIIGKDDMDGIELTWGNAPAIIAILEKMAKRDGFGDILADGSRAASHKIGKGSEQCAVHVHGQEPGLHDGRIFSVRGLGYIAAAAPGRHQLSTPSVRLLTEGRIGWRYPELQKPEGDSETEVNGKIHAIANSYTQVFSDCGLCLFALSPGTDIPLIEFINAVTGWDVTAPEILQTGRRILALRQAFNMREGLRARDFRLPDRMSRPPEMGPFSGLAIDFNALKASFYRAMGWNEETGIPSPNCLAELEIEDVVGDI
ncbi:MAG: aldehyde ferredoxin oxidoreductase family protein [Deltaproteobacteria bacterium]|nr:aldehyde ferredoxin oxidoreductase family protein [Deltaproteobacteria bacterium]